MNNTNGVSMKKEINKYGTICYYDENRKLHREDGPAIEYTSGDKDGLKMENFIEKMVQL